MLPSDRLVGRTSNSSELAIYGAEDDMHYFPVNVSYLTASQEVKLQRAKNKVQSLIEELDTNEQSLIDNGYTLEQINSLKGLMENEVSFEAELRKFAQAEKHRGATSRAVLLEQGSPKPVSMDDFVSQLRSSSSLSEEAEDRLQELVKIEAENSKKFK
jgi:hypothetical protein